MHDNSTEEEKYLAAIKRETAAFERLFMMKQHMAVPEEQEGRLYELDEEEEKEEKEERQTSTNPMQLALYKERQMKLKKPLFANDALDLKKKMEDDAVSTRKAGGRVMKRLTLLHVVVDIREFMSTLPAVLHQCGYTLLPCTLEVGDYVLSPDICVERKAIPDLVQSLKSGRLYTQAEAMCKH
jgi:DNA excision repair protein ERCC-4